MLLMMYSQFQSTLSKPISFRPPPGMLHHPPKGSLPGRLLLSRIVNGVSFSASYSNYEALLSPVRREKISPLALQGEEKSGRNCNLGATKILPMPRS